jgi:hypothetical protein
MTTRLAARFDELVGAWRKISTTTRIVVSKTYVPPPTLLQASPGPGDHQPPLCVLLWPAPVTCPSGGAPGKRRPPS